MPVRRMVLGVQAGVIAGLVFLSLCAFFSVLSRDAWWWTANVYGSSFYGPRSLRWGLGWITLAGTALQVVLSGVAGALYAFVLLGTAIGGLALPLVVENDANDAGAAADANDDADTSGDDQDSPNKE